MEFIKVALLLTCVAVVRAVVPVEELYLPKPYSFGYAIKDKHGEQHRQEVGDGAHNVRGSYGFKDERGIERQVNYIADKGGFRAEVKTNEPGTAPSSPAGVKMESSAHPYFGIAKRPVAAGFPKEGFPFAGGFGLPGVLRMDAEELAKSGMAFDSGLAKENELEREALRAEIGKEGLVLGSEIGLEKLAKEGLIFPPGIAQSLLKDPEAAKSLGLTQGFALEELIKKGFAIVPLDMLAAEKAAIEKEKLALLKTLSAEELARMRFIYPQLLAGKNLAFSLKGAELEKEGLALEKFREALSLAPQTVKAPLPYLSPVPYSAAMPEGYTFGGPLLGGFVKGYDARYL